MPRRKIGADLKEALCKLYEAGDITADVIEKHGIMSRATFFRNLKMYKSGASLEQRHSTGRKTNADKMRQQEKREFDQLQPPTLDHFELVLVDDRDLLDRVDSKKKGRNIGSSKGKKRDLTGSGSHKDTNLPHSNEDDAGDLSGSDSDSEDDNTIVAARQAFDRLSKSARDYLLRSTLDQTAASGQASNFLDSNSDIETICQPEDSHYSHKNRGAVYVVRQKNGDGGSIVAAVALRSLIWTPSIYQALGSSYASRSIDKISFLTRIHVDQLWRRQGIGRWLVNVVELRASKLGFSHIYTQCDANHTELLKFWQKVGLKEFTRFQGQARLEKTIATAPASAIPDQQGRKRASTTSTNTSKGVEAAHPTSNQAMDHTAKKRKRKEAAQTGPDSTRQAGPMRQPAVLSSTFGNDGQSALVMNPSGGQLDPSLSMLPTSAMLSASASTSTSAPAFSSNIGTESSVTHPFMPTSMGQHSSINYVGATPSNSDPNAAMVAALGGGAMPVGPPPRKIAFHETGSQNR